MDSTIPPVPAAPITSVAEGEVISNEQIARMLVHVNARIEVAIAAAAGMTEREAGKARQAVRENKALSLEIREQVRGMKHGVPSTWAGRLSLVGAAVLVSAMLCAGMIRYAHRDAARGFHSDRAVSFL